MADSRTLKATIVLEGDAKFKQKLVEIQREGDKTIRTVKQDGKVISQTVTEFTKTSIARNNSLKLSYLAISQGLRDVYTAAKPVVDFLLDSAQAARDDETSISRRNAALEKYKDVSVEYIAALDAQVRSYQKLYGISDETTREIQTQLIAFGANKDQIQKLTDATIALSEITGEKYDSAARKVVRFMNGEMGNAIKGTTIKVGAHASVQERLNALLSGTSAGIDILTDKMKTGQGAQDRWKESMDEFKEGIGAFFNTEFAVDQLGKLTDALNALTDWINSHQRQLEGFADVMQRIGMAIATGGISEIDNQIDLVKNLGKQQVAQDYIGPLAPNQRYRKRRFRGLTMRKSKADQSFPETDSPGVHLTMQQELRKAFGPDAVSGLVGTFMSGGVKDTIASAGSIAGGALGGPLGAIAGGFLGKALGGLFGHKKHENKGMTPGNPIYVEDVKQSALLAQALNSSRGLMIGGTGANVDWAIMQLRYSSAGAQ